MEETSENILCRSIWYRESKSIGVVEIGRATIVEAGRLDGLEKSNVSVRHED
jgi:hypothetical protein